MSWAPIMIGITKLPRPANAGMTNRKIISAACTENSPLKVPGAKYCWPGVASSARTQLGEQAADHEEDERGDQVLDADHLVVGVDLEVVLPRVRAVVGVILVLRRGAADQVAPPVVPAADPDGEADAGEEHHERLDDAGAVGGRTAGEVADPHDDARGRKPHERRDPDRADPAPRAATRCASARRCRGGGPVPLSPGHVRPIQFPPSNRYLTSASIWAAVRLVPKFGGMTPPG